MLLLLSLITSNAVAQSPSSNNTASTLSEQQMQGLREQAQKEYQQGNYRDAWQAFQKLLTQGSLSSDEQAEALALDLSQAIHCLSQLGEINQFDEFVDSVAQRYADQWRILAQAGASYNRVEKTGYIIGGEFQRGYHRGGGHYVNTHQRDRIRALQLYRQAWLLLEQGLSSEPGVSQQNNSQQASNNTINGHLYNLLQATASVINPSNSGQSWRLQILSDLEALPDYQDGYYRQNHLGAPVDANGDIVLFEIPSSFDAAQNDGERWRYVLQQAAQVNDGGQHWSEWIWADFLWQQYGVQTMAQSSRRYFQTYAQDSSGNNASDTEKSIFNLQNLSDVETIAKLATGIKRFDLPANYNFIELYKSLVDSPSYQFGALLRLATIYENRRQLPKAADYWQQLIGLSASPQDQHRNSLAQIVGAWAQFEPLKAQAQNKPQKQVGLRFRNATSVKLTARRINSERFLRDIKTHLSRATDRLDWQKLNIADIGRQLIDGNSSYRGRVLRSWTQTLEPAPNHLDKYTQIDLPENLHGAYLLEAEVAGGNTNYIVVWNSEAIIVKKPMREGVFYYVADAYTGQPLVNHEVNFLGYRQQRQRIENSRDNQRPWTYQIHTQEFTRNTDESGQIIIDQKDLDANYQWLVHTKPQDNEFAFLGFNSVWYSQYDFWQKQRTKAYIISSQPAYRPGQTVELSAWVQTASYDNQEADTQTNPQANRTFRLQIYNPKGEKVSDQQITSDKFGGISHSLELPDDATLGVYGVVVAGIESHGQFRVEEYKKPEYEVLIEAPDKPVALGEVVKAKVKANYYFGAPVAEAKVKIKIERFEHNVRWYPYNTWDWLYGKGYWWFGCDMAWYPGWDNWGMRAPIHSWLSPNMGAQPELIQETEVEIGADGSADIVIDTEAAKLLHGDKDHRYQISVEVVDSSRRSVYGSGEVLVSRQAYQVFAWVDKGYYQTGDTVQAQFQVQSLDQKPVQGSGTAELFRLHYDQAGDVEESLVQTWSLDNDDEGQATLRLNASRAGQYRLAYRLDDEQGNSQEGAYVFNVVAANTAVDDDSYRFNDLEIIADRTHYAPGDELRLLVNSQHDDAHVLLFERPQNNYSKPKALKLAGNSQSHSFVLSAEDRPNIFVEALTIRNGEVFSIVKEIAIPPKKSVVNVDIESNKDEYKPGEEAEIQLRLTDEEGKPFVGSTIVAVYDKALDYIAGGVKPPPIREFFWQWKRHHNPMMENSAIMRYGPMVKEDDQRMRLIGVFGNRVYESNLDVGGALEEVVVTASLQSRSASDDAAPMMAMEVAAPAPAGRQQVDSEQKPSGNSEPPIEARSDFADSAYWLSHVVSDQQGKASVKFTMPDNLTTWLTSVWTMGENAQVGQASKDLITSKNLLLRLQAPRFFVEKDEVVLSANVHNYLESEQDIQVSLQLDGEEIGLISDETLAQTITVAANGEQRVDWRVKVQQEGLAKIRMLAMSQTSADESDAVEMDFPVYVHGQLITQSFSGALSPAQESGVINFTVPEQRRAEQSRLELRYSPTLAGAMVDALPYLVAFPYGCTEQTLSRFLPTVMVQKVLQQSNIDLDSIKNKRSNLNAQEIGDDEKRAQQWQQYKHNPVFDIEEVGNMSRSGIERLSNMQLSDGGWGWFSGYGERSSPHTTAYVVHGLQMAKAVDLNVDASVLQRGIQWLQYYQAQELQKLNNAASQTRPYKTRANNVDAFVAMVLSESNQSSAPMIDALYRDRLSLSIYAQSMLALTLDAVDRVQERDLVRRNIEQFLVVDDENQTAYLKMENNYWWYWYGSEFEAQAYYLKLLAKIEPNGDIAPRLVKYLLNNRKHATYWNSTRDTAVVIEAMSDYLIASGEAAPDINLDITLNGETVKTVSVNQENLFDFDNNLIIEGIDLNPGEHQLEIVKSGSGPLYYNAYVNNFSLEDKLEKQGLELKVERRFYKLTAIEATSDVAGSGGQAIKQNIEKYQRTEIDEDSVLESGDLVEIELLIDSKNDYEYILIEDMKAAGFEAITVQSGYLANNANGLRAYVEYRDNRVAFFVQQLARGSHSLSYRLKAEIPGKFSALPTKIEAMYAPELKANSDSYQLNIEDNSLKQAP